jgi:Tfp pilus assembly protein PilX
MLTRTLPSKQQQSGAILIFTLIVLVTMIMASIALMRSSDTTSFIAGNLAFKESATHSCERGIETAIEWLEANNYGDNLYQNVDDDNDEYPEYLAARQDPAIGQTWDDFFQANHVVTLAADAAGNTVSYIIHRLCNTTGAPSSGIDCSVSPAAEMAGSSKGAGVVSMAYSFQVYYRITARSVGPRNTVSYVQAIVTM